MWQSAAFLKCEKAHDARRCAHLFELMSSECAEPTDLTWLGLAGLGLAGLGWTSHPQAHPHPSPPILQVRGRVLPLRSGPPSANVSLEHTRARADAALLTCRVHAARALAHVAQLISGLYEPLLTYLLTYLLTCLLACLLTYLLTLARSRGAAHPWPLRALTYLLTYLRACLLTYARSLAHVAQLIRGLYEPFVRDWHAAFGRESLLVLKAEDLLDRPAQARPPDLT
jgi:hypothetical protein